MRPPSPRFSTISGPAAASIIARDRALITGLVKDAYSAFGAGTAINQHSCFLTFADSGRNPNDRIIALPACILGDVRVAGIKWISSFPHNVQQHLPRASAVLILNDLETGFPFVCMEGSIISAARTAASAVIGADVICGGARAVGTIGFVGTGVIAAAILDFFLDLQWRFGRVCLFDLVPERSRAFAQRVSDGFAGPVQLASSVEELLGQVDLLVLATTASKPYIFDAGLFSSHPRILNISLRDLAPEVILSADNVVDDTDHCLRANTSLHLTEQQTRSREFVSAKIYDCFAAGSTRSWKPNPNRTTIFSPFGMGILDVAVGMHVYRVAAQEGMLADVDGFFAC